MKINEVSNPKSQEGGTTLRDVAFDYLSGELKTEEAVLGGRHLESRPL